MSNILRVAAHLAAAYRVSDLAEPERRSRSLVRTGTGTYWWRDEEGGFWRAYRFIEGCHSIELADAPAKAFSLGEAVGRFQTRLAVTIPAFHDSRSRYAAFEAAVEGDRVGRVASAAKEIAWFRAHHEGLDCILAALESGEIPERISHNDAKMANLLLDDRSDEAICLVDLDTVMPGSQLYDFGDLVRTVTASVEEDSDRPEANVLRRELFEALVRGYARGAAGLLTAAERRLLPEGGRVITLIMGL